MPSFNFSKEEIKKRAKKIESVYNEYLAKLDVLKKKQAAIITQFIKKMEQKKIEEIRARLKK